jgi:hypothetical protein
MMRVAMRALMIVLALLLAVASAGTVLCEMDCAAGGHTQAAAAMSDSASGLATSHCDGEQMDSARHDMPAPHGSSGGNTKHGGVHLHPRIMATTTPRIQISPSLRFSGAVTGQIVFSATLAARTVETFRNDGSPPPINFPSVFSSGVLRI